MTTTRDALLDYCAARNLADQPQSVEDCYRDDWIRVQVGRWRVPFFPTFAVRDGLLLHDVHHLVTGYETSWRGELEIAAWELGSGGCARHLYFWLDRILFMLLGFVFAPLSALRAFRRGRRNRNVFRLDPDSVLSMDVEELGEYVAG